jgi:membrane protein insertase Oxa1/YidC/SpoIIIJ
MTDSEFATTEQVTAQELAEVIQEFERYRERLVNETMETAKRAKLMKSAVMAKLEPELAKIDATLKSLQDRQAALSGDR